jgi:phosphatidylglycerol lysyltransferase
MKPVIFTTSFFKFLKERSLPFLRENGKILTQFIFALFFIGLAIWFVKHEKTEFHDVRHLLVTSRWQLIVMGTCFTLAYILLQGLMYKAAFASLKARVPLHAAILLFLKRNFISVFLPAGGISSLMFFIDDIEKRGVSKTQINLSSSIYAFTGVLSVVLVAVPAFIFAILKKSVSSGELYALAGAISLITLIYLAYRSVRNNGIVHRWLVRFFPVTEVFLADLRERKIIKKFFVLGLLASVCVELAGISLLYLTMTALKVHPSLFAAVMGYITSVVLLVASPFLRGLGAVEVSMTLILVRFGYTNVEAITITLLYRFFEFWLTFFTGMLSFLLKVNKLLMRIIPTLLILTLGVINIVSVLTPAIASRLERLQDFLPLDAINASNYLVLAAGLFMLVTAAFLLKGLRSAWWFAFLLSAVSFIGHLTKAIDYEEAIVAFIVMLVLLGTRKDYYIRTNPKLRSVGIQTALLATLAVLVYGTIGFYFLDKKHFNIDFSFIESIRYTLQNYFLATSAKLVPSDPFATHFLLSIKICGLLSMTFLVYAFIRPYVAKKASTEEDLQTAKTLLDRFGNSGMDYFKIYPDKLIYTTEGLNAFISYRVAGNFAVVLENPVAQDKDKMKECVVSFDKYCYENGLKSIFYRVPEESLPIYQELRKKGLFLGQEGVINLETFTLEGRDRKTLRHSVNKVTESGYRTTVNTPPIKDGTLQKIKSVSDEWLLNTGRKEIIFSQGMFRWDELKQQTLITVESPEEKIVAFLNVIPDYAPGEGTYDLLRKTNDSPNGTTEFLLIRLCEYFRSLGYHYVNLGFAPMSGIDDPRTFPEKSMQFAYEKLGSFSHYKGLREFKERFFPEWFNKYLIYGNDYDLIQIPRVLSRIIKP